MRICGLVLLMAICYTKSFAWGFYVHKLINYNAVFLLPPDMMVLYKPHITFLSEHAVDPDKRRYAVKEEGARHYIDVDKYGTYPYSDLPRSWGEAAIKYSEDSLRQHGIVPWWIQVMLQRLTDAFRECDQSRILKLSAEIGHYIGDAHVPLHACSNHNGQFTNQRGIHGFWESRVPELLAEKEWDFIIGRADYVKKPLDLTWRKVLESAIAADSVLKFEKRLNDSIPSDRKYAFENRNGVMIKQYSTEYCAVYNHMLDGMIERRLRESIHTVASFWYTAWVNAGQPDLTKLRNKEFSGQELKEFEELTEKWKNGYIKGKSCD